MRKPAANIFIFAIARMQKEDTEIVIKRATARDSGGLSWSSRTALKMDTHERYS